MPAMLRGVALSVSTLLLLSSSTVPQTTSVAARAAAWFAAREATFIAFRHDLHRYPELSGDEFKTAAAVAARLQAAGLEVTTGVGGQGVIARLRGGRPGPLVAYRADMDAVRSDAPDPAPYGSTRPGIRHICGHDVHTTIGVALAESLASGRSELAGSILFIFQPSEENARGANDMLAAGIFDRELPRSIFGLHTAPLNVGQLATGREVMMPARDRVTITAPRAGQLEGPLRLLATIPAERAFESIAGDFVVYDGGFATINSNPTVLHRVEANYTVSSPAARAAVRDRINALVAPFGADVRVEYIASRIAGVTNTPALADRAVATVRGVLGEANVRVIETMVPAFSEDFGAFQAKTPGVFFFLGVSNPAAQTVGMPHRPDYVADDGAIGVGVRAMAAVLVDALR